MFIIGRLIPSGYIYSILIFVPCVRLLFSLIVFIIVSLRPSGYINSILNVLYFVIQTLNHIMNVFRAEIDCLAKKYWFSLYLMIATACQLQGMGLCKIFN